MKDISWLKAVVRVQGIQAGEAAAKTIAPPHVHSRVVGQRRPLHKRIFTFSSFLLFIPVTRWRGCVYEVELGALCMRV